MLCSVQETNQKEKIEQQINEWIGEGHKGLFLRPNGDYRPDEVLSLNLQTNSKN